MICARYTFALSDVLLPVFETPDCTGMVIKVGPYVALFRIQAASGMVGNVTQPPGHNSFKFICPRPIRT